MQKYLTVVLSRSREGGPEARSLEKAVLEGLNQWPELPVLVVPHLYDLLPKGMGFEALRKIATNMVVLSWLYPRAVFWVLQANGVQGRLGASPMVPEEELDLEPADTASPTGVGKAPSSPSPDSSSVRTIWCLDLRNPGEVKAYLKEIDRLVELTQARSVPLPQDLGPPETLGPYTMQEIDELLQPRWYPVIDQSRCKNCQECLNFCLFGVFGLDAQGRVRVEMPDMCRPGCPACARVCPWEAIMFPHYPDAAIAGGPGKVHTSGNPMAHLLVDLGSPSLSGTGGSGGSKSSASESPPGASPPTETATPPTSPGGVSSGASEGGQTLDRLVDELDQMDP